MTPELTVLVLAALLQVLQYALMSVPANMELGTRSTLSPRDPDAVGDLQAQMSRRTARLNRALTNHFEGLALFTIAALVIAVTDQSSALTAACAWTYLAARILYVPAYAYGWVPWRSLIWLTGFLATALMLVSALL
jgi:uncharacterized MAPEG superfamily protein